MNNEALNARFVEPLNERRALYNEVVYMFRNAPENTPILPSTLRSEVVLGIQNSIDWNFKVNEPNTQGGATAVRSSEIRLQVNDCFVASSVSVYFGNELTAGIAPSRVLLQTWENPAAVAVLPLTIGGFGTNAMPLIQAYNGSLDMVVNATQYLRGLWMLNFKRVDTAQAGTTLFTASTQAQSYFKADDVAYPLVPSVNLSGRDTIKLTCNIPDQADFTTVAANRVIAVAILNGILVQNGAAGL